MSATEIIGIVAAFSKVALLGVLVWLLIEVKQIFKSMK